MTAVHVALPPPLRTAGPGRAPDMFAHSVKTSPTFASSDLFTPFSAPARVTLPTIAKFHRPAYGKGATWGTATTNYGGVGTAAGRMKQLQEGATSRSHRHYSTGCTNCYAPEQPYSVTKLTLSACRPCDQHLPKPLITEDVVQKQQKEVYPRNDTFTSHKPIFDVFPPALPKNCGKEALTPRTAEALISLNAGLHCTTTYQQQHRNFFVAKCDSPSGHTEARSRASPKECMVYSSTLQTGSENCHVPSSSSGSSSSSDGDSSDGSSEREQGLLDEERDPAEQLESSQQESISESTSVDTIAASQMNPDISQNKSNTSGQTTEQDHAPAVSDASSACLWTNTPVGYAAVFRVTQRQAMPEHFQRNSAKYTSNRLPNWPCYVPYYLFSKHSLLADNVAPGAFKSVQDGARGEKSGDCRRRCSGESSEAEAGLKIPYLTEAEQRRLLQVAGTADQAKSKMQAVTHLVKLPTLVVDHGASTFNSGSGAHLSEEDGGDGACREAEEEGAWHEEEGAGHEEVSPLASLLTPLGSRVPHRIGLHFKATAHQRYHSLYPDAIPDLRDSRVVGKKHFFHGHHASVFRG